MTDDGALAALSAAARERLRPADVPSFTEPMLATLVDEPFSDPGWLFERKLDGERCLAFGDGDSLRLRSRGDNELDATYPELAPVLRRCGPERFVLDGEVVAFAGTVTSFERLQQRIGLTDSDQARRSSVAVFYYVFDLLHLDGYDLSGLALRDRKRLLRRAIAFTDPLRFTPHRNADGEAFLADACARGWEGLIAKDAEASYDHGRSRRWLKLKCVHRQELVIGGYTDPEGGRTQFGALLVGYYEGERLVYAGKVGTGFDEATLADLGGMLAERRRGDPPFAADDLPREAVHWVDPSFVAEIGFTEWTAEGKLRHPRYLGLRRDKPAREVTRERPQRARPAR